MKIELLYLDGCPSYQKAEKILREVLKEENIEEEIERIDVRSEEQAKELGFLGSPTIRINKEDIDSRARQSKEFGLKCRIYNIGEEILGWPSKEMIREALKGR